jgi:amphi-Trp domain-containing protein
VARTSIAGVAAPASGLRTLRFDHDGRLECGPGGRSYTVRLTRSACGPVCWSFVSGDAHAPGFGEPSSRVATSHQPTKKGELMDIFEVEQKERLSREEVAARLRNLADMLARHNDIEFERGGMRFTVPVPDQIELTIELEIESDKRELEIELTW